MSQQDDWIEAQLRARRIEPVHDDGFSERLTAQLHLRRAGHRSTPRWIVPTLSGIGALLTGVTGRQQRGHRLSLGRRSRSRFSSSHSLRLWSSGAVVRGHCSIEGIAPFSFRTTAMNDR